MHLGAYRLVLHRQTTGSKSRRVGAACSPWSRDPLHHRRCKWYCNISTIIITCSVVDLRHVGTVRIWIRGSVHLTKRYGSGSGSVFFSNVFCLLIFEGKNIHHFLKKKVIKKSQNKRNQRFYYYFCLKIEGSGAKLLTKGSGSRRPKTYGQYRYLITDHNYSL
jgi:hypothetical protein